MVSIQARDVPELLIHFTMFLQNKHNKDVNTVLTESEMNYFLKVSLDLRLQCWEQAHELPGTYYE